jgi:hypothetical protein
MWAFFFGDGHTSESRLGRSSVSRAKLFAQRLLDEKAPYGLLVFGARAWSVHLPLTAASIGQYLSVHDVREVNGPSSRNWMTVWRVLPNENSFSGSVPPRSVWPWNWKSASRNLDRLVLRTG